MVVGFYVQNNPFNEEEGLGIYPSIRFYLGTFKLIADILGIKEINFISTNKASRKKNKSNSNDVSYLIEDGYSIKVLPHDTEVEFDILVASIMVYRPKEHYDFLDRLASNSRRLIYLESDSEVSVDSKSLNSLYRKLREGSIPNVERKLTDVLTTISPTFADAWEKFGARTHFIPYISHPYYIKNPRKVVGSYDYELASIRSLSKGELRGAIENKFSINDIVEPNDMRIVDVSTLADKIEGSKILLGTTFMNSKAESSFRVTSKVIEALHSGALPTFMRKNSCEDLYPYMELIPDELRFLDSFRKLKPADLADKIDKALKLDTREVVDKLYDEVFDFHSPERWRSLLEDILLGGSEK